ncbi:hypothetical protein D0Z03_002067 [Geotrichum reessii]|nr:hypothetical protein D0Z03_002067 [Galactomyces reessii]
MSKSFVRTLKNKANGYTPTQVKVRNVCKSLTVLDYLLRNGSDGAVLWIKDNIHLIRTLNQFEYVDDDGRDHGKYVREKSKELVELVSNETQLKQLRLETQEKRRSSSVQAESNRARPSRQSAARSDENDAELQLALEVSMQSALEEEERRKQLSNDDDDLKKAIQLSKQEDSKHSANASAITTTGKDLFGTSTSNADYANSAFNSITIGNYNYNGNVDASIPISTNNTFQNTNSHNPFITPTSPKIPATNAGYSNYVQAAPTGYGFGNVQQQAHQQQHEQKSHQPTQSLIDL